LKYKTGNNPTEIIAPRNIILNVLFNIARFIDFSALKYSKSLNFPIPGLTALDQVKKIPVINPVNNKAEAKMIDPISIFII
jgi:hypothetical protein